MTPVQINRLCERVIAYRDSLSSRADRDMLADVCNALDGYTKLRRDLAMLFAPFAREAKNWPDYAPDSDGLFIASPDDVIPILDEYASACGRVSAGISYSDDVVTVGDLRALARAAALAETAE